MILPTQDYRRTHIVTPQKLHRGLDGFVHGLVGRYQRRNSIARTMQVEAEKIYHAAGEFRHLADGRLRERLRDLQARFRKQEAKDIGQCLPDALAMLVEAADRKLGLRPYPVQVMGAMALYHGYLTEMVTGEGKSLTACLPAVLAAWT